MRRIHLLTSIFLCSYLSLNAQTATIDSLKRVVVKAGNMANKEAAIFQLCNQGYNLNPDTLMNYAELARTIAVKNDDVHDEVQAMYYESSALTDKGLIDSSLNLADKCLRLFTKLDDPVLQANLFNQKGRCYMRKNQYKEAIEMGYRVIETAEKSANILLQIKGKTLIGWAYLEMGQIREALTWHLKALQTTSDTVLLENYSILFANLAINYNDLQKIDSALFYINKAILFSRKHDNLFALSNSLAIEAQIYVRSGQGSLAEYPLKEVINIRKQIGDPFYIVSDMSQLALYYAHYGHPEKGILLCNEGIALARQYKMDTKLFFLYSTLAENYKAHGDTNQYASVLEKIILLKDSVYKSNSAEALAEMQTKYDLQKKENIIIQQKVGIVTKDFLLFGSVALVFFSIIIFSIFFRNYKRKQQMNMHLMVQDQKRKSFIAISSAEENERKRIAADLHDNMGAYASAIIANVDELIHERHQLDELMLKQLKKNADEIMSSLRDTIWALNKEKMPLTAISDRMKSYVQKVSAANPEISIDVEEKIDTNILLSTVQSLNIIRILKEAVTNSLKHSDGDNIKICIFCDGSMNLSVTDNGKGINQERMQGNGIRNMQQRAGEAGFIFSIDNMSNGTKIILHPE